MVVGLRCTPRNSEQVYRSECLRAADRSSGKRVGP
jgi:hypothetical protein